MMKFNCRTSRHKLEKLLEEQAQLYKAEEKRDFIIAGGLTISDYVDREKANHQHRQKDKTVKKVDMSTSRAVNK